MTEAEIAADVSARYGVPVCPTVVKLLPPRTFSATLPVWNGKTLAYPDAAERKAQWRDQMWSAARAKAASATRGAAIDAETAARRDAIRNLHAQGRTVVEIMADLGHPRHVVSYAMAAMGLAPHSHAAILSLQADVRKRTVVKMRAEGADPAAVAALLGVGVDCVQRIARAAGCGFPKASRKKCGGEQ